jgi:hypothetical protein
MKTKADIWIRSLGLVLGVTVAAIAVVSSRIPAGTGVLGADIILASAPTGELNVTPTGPFLTATNLTPSSPASSGSIAVFNQTGSSLDVAVRGLPSSTDMDKIMLVQVAADGTSIYDGTLGGFRDWTTKTISLASGQTTHLTLRTWLDPRSGEAWSGRITQVGIEFDSIPVGAKP